jgi:hypothetical protein
MDAPSSASLNDACIMSFSSLAAMVNLWMAMGIISAA